MRNLLLNLKKKAGFTLAELVVTTAVMGTLAAVAVPKFSNVNERAKARKTMANIDNILTAAMNIFNEYSISAGRGRFPGQDDFKDPVTTALRVFDNAEFRAAFGFATSGGETELAGDVTLKSPYEDGYYSFTITGGGETGEKAYSPTITVYDEEAPGDYWKSLTP